MWDVIQPYVEIRSADQKPSIEETCANYSLDEWVVKGEDGRIAVSRRQVSPAPTPQALPFDIAPADNAAQRADVEDGLSGQLHFEKVVDGYLLGFNAGELGGALWWFSPDGKERKRLGTENAHGFIRLGGSLYALTGLAHLGGNEGSLVKLTQESSRNWKATEAANLGGAPEAFTQDSNGDVFVVTPKKLIRISVDAKIETVHPAKIDWGVLYPTSIVKADDGKIYIGMRYAVARLTPENGSYKEEWLVPKKCQTWELVQNDLKCVCRD